MAGQELLFALGILRIIVGFSIALVAAVLMISTSAKNKGTFKGVCVVIIGPFPIIFGTDKELAKLFLVLSIVPVSILLIFSILPSWLPR